MRALHRMLLAPWFLLPGVMVAIEAQTTTTDVRRPERNEARLRWLPFAFYTETFDTGFGAACAVKVMAG